MTPKERFVASMALQSVDRVPAMYQHLGGAYHLQEVTRTSISEGLRDVEGHKRLCLGALREFGFDNVMVGWGDILGEAEALGIGVDYGNPRVYPQGREMDPERIASLEPADPWSGKIWSVQLRAARELVQEVGDEVLVIASMNDPFLVASAVRGFELLLMDQIADPESAHRLLGTVLGTLKEGARIMREECGIEVVFLADGIADSSQNDLASSLAFDIPYSAELVGHMRHLGLRVVLSNCALAGYVEEQLRDCAPDAMHIASEGKAYLRMSEMMRGDRCLIAGISPMRKILPMAPDEIDAEVKRVMSEFGDGPGLIVSSAGEMPLETAPENIVALARATRRNHP
ncbi:MAG: uroporphyrinogen decarboxylase family protein [Methanomassiliicoccales archaeon]|nr:uroporphyrinogen decarboxylase family protein [Methanomassiliicoccales archaeon]